MAIESLGLYSDCPRDVQAAKKNAGSTRLVKAVCEGAESLEVAMVGTSTTVGCKLQGVTSRSCGPRACLVSWALSCQELASSQTNQVWLSQVRHV